jgi:hypothetical protein
MTSPATYVALPVPVDAMQFTPANMLPLTRWLTAELGPGRFEISDTHLLIETLEGDRDCPPGYWVVKGTMGEFYPVHPDVFAAKYRREDGAE